MFSAHARTHTHTHTHSHCVGYSESARRRCRGLRSGVSTRDSRAAQHAIICSTRFGHGRVPQHRAVHRTTPFVGVCGIPHHGALAGYSRGTHTTHLRGTVRDIARQSRAAHSRTALRTTGYRLRVCSCADRSSNRIVRPRRGQHR